MTGLHVIASVVEGYGEVTALPLLVRRIAMEVFDVAAVDISKPHRVPRNQMTSHILQRAVETQSARVENLGGVLVLADADDDDPRELEASLAKAAGGNQVKVSVAVKEYEAWFLASMASLQAHRSVRDDAVFDGNPEAPRDAKGELSARMVEKYRETIHQPAFSAIMDISQSRRCPSFNSFVRNVGNLLGVQYE